MVEIQVMIFSLQQRLHKQWEKVKIFSQYAAEACYTFPDGLRCSMVWGRIGAQMHNLDILKVTSQSLSIR